MTTTLTQLPLCRVSSMLSDMQDAERDLLAKLIEDTQIGVPVDDRNVASGDPPYLRRWGREARISVDLDDIDGLNRIPRDMEAVVEHDDLCAPNLPGVRVHYELVEYGGGRATYEPHEVALVDECEALADKLRPLMLDDLEPDDRREARGFHATAKIESAAFLGQGRLQVIATVELEAC